MWLGPGLARFSRLSSEGRVMEEQGGLRAKRNCIDQVFAFRQVMEKAIEKRRELFTLGAHAPQCYSSWVCLCVCV